MMTLESAVAWSIAIALAYLTATAGAAIVAALRAGGRREDPVDTSHARSISRFTIPVSIVVSVPKTCPSAARAVAALLDLNYPEFEVIVVADGATHPIVETLGQTWQLEAREFFYRRTIDTADVRRLYRSTTDARLLVVDKASRGYSDAVNCGVNLSRYRYFVTIAPDVVFDRDALLRVMKVPLGDPANVVSVSSHVEEAIVDPEAAAGVMRRANALFQQLASVRSLMDTWIVWRRLRGGLAPSGAVVVWRRDAVVRAHGFSADAADPDLDLMFRLQTSGTESARVSRSGDLFGRTSAPPIAGALRRAGRRQLAVLRILWMSAHTRDRRLAPRTLVYLIKSELLTPLALFWIPGAAIGGTLLGWYSWSTLVLLIAMVAFGSASVTAAALLVRGSAPGAPEERQLRHLLLAAPLEFVVYRPALAVARLAGALAFVRGAGGANRPA